jgi:hypothetical protein
VTGFIPFRIGGLGRRVLRKARASLSQCLRPWYPLMSRCVGFTDQRTIGIRNRQYGSPKCPIREYCILPPHNPKFSSWCTMVVKVQNAWTIYFTSKLWTSGKRMIWVWNVQDVVHQKIEYVSLRLLNCHMIALGVEARNTTKELHRWPRYASDVADATKAGNKTWGRLS